MRFAALKIVFVCSFISFASTSFSQWNLSKDKEGIKVFESAMGNSNFKRIKVECILDGSIDKLVAVLTDVAHHKDWIYNNKDAYLLKKINPDEFYYYTETYLPWPMSNRDAVAHIKIVRDSLNRFLDVIEVGEPKYMPEKNGIVRVPKFSINWHVTVPATNRLGVTYILEVEPGGSVPAWLANMFVDKGPYESFKKLEEILKR